MFRCVHALACVITFEYMGAWTYVYVYTHLGRCIYVWVWVHVNIFICVLTQSSVIMNDSVCASAFVSVYTSLSHWRELGEYSADGGDQAGFGVVGSHVSDVPDVWPNGVVQRVQVGEEGASERRVQSRSTHSEAKPGSLWTCGSAPSPAATPRVCHGPPDCTRGYHTAEEFHQWLPGPFR